MKTESSPNSGSASGSTKDGSVGTSKRTCNLPEKLPVDESFNKDITKEYVNSDRDSEKSSESEIETDDPQDAQGPPNKKHKRKLFRKNVPHCAIMKIVRFSYNKIYIKFFSKF